MLVMAGGRSSRLAFRRAADHDVNESFVLQRGRLSSKSLRAGDWPRLPPGAFHLSPARDPHEIGGAMPQATQIVV